jgi:uncharacterized protein
MATNLKPSQFNFLFDLEDGTHLAFNGMSGAFVKIRNEQYESVKLLLTDPNVFDVASETDQCLLDTAIRSRFVIESNIDELQILKFRENVNRYSSETFHLTIMPTMECNFACPYCYEIAEKGKMSLDAQNALLCWVNEKLLGCRAFIVGWFGGEPLMAHDVLRYLMIEFRKLCDKHNVTFISGVTTNGFFLIPKIVSKLKELPIRQFQVTIDGPPDEHDKRRILKSGKGSFYKIINNLCHLCEIIENPIIILRVNYDSMNFDKIPELFSYIPESLKSKSEIYFRQVFPPPRWWDTQAPIKISSIPPNPEPIAATSLQKKAQDHGFKLFLTEHWLKAGYCEADYVNRFVVDPWNNLHKCTVAFDKVHRVGFIKADGQAVIDTHILSKWMLRDTFERDNCRQCRILPMCMGGCNLNTLCNKGRAICSTVIDDGHMVETLRMFYRNIIIEEQRKSKKRNLTSVISPESIHSNDSVLQTGNK